MKPITVRWPGGEHPFRFGISEAEIVQQKTDCGPEHLLNKIRLGQWFVDELYEVLRNGLIGGGMGHVEAQKAVKTAMEKHPLINFKVPAMEVVSSLLYGDPDDPVGEPLPVEMPTPENEKTVSGNSAPTTE